MATTSPAWARDEDRTAAFGHLPVGVKHNNDLARWHIAPVIRITSLPEHLNAGSLKTYIRKMIYLRRERSTGWLWFLEYKSVTSRVDNTTTKTLKWIDESSAPAYFNKAWHEEVGEMGEMNLFSPLLFLVNKDHTLQIGAIKTAFNGLAFTNPIPPANDPNMHYLNFTTSPGDE